MGKSGKISRVIVSIILGVFLLLNLGGAPSQVLAMESSPYQSKGVSHAGVMFVEEGEDAREDSYKKNPTLPKTGESSSFALVFGGFWILMILFGIILIKKYQKGKKE